MPLTLSGGAQLTWLGHSAFELIIAQKKVILLDPWLSGNPKCPQNRKHVERVDHILLTHGHGDHAGDIVAIGKEHKPNIVTIVELGGWLEKQGIENVVAADLGGSYSFDDVTVTLVRADHTSSAPNSDGTYVGVPVGFVINLAGGPTLYYAGDTDVFSDMSLIGELYKPDIALLPIGDFYTMGPRGAALATRLLGVKQVIPMHFGTFPVLIGNPTAFRKELAGFGLDDVHVIEMQPGV